jgi:hypothetical protein
MIAARAKMPNAIGAFQLLTNTVCSAAPVVSGWLCSVGGIPAVDARLLVETFSLT